MHDCPVCQVLENPTVTPGDIIKEYRYWILSHIKPPIPIAGWLVLSSRQHVEGLVNLSKRALQEYAEIMGELTKHMQRHMDVKSIFNTLDPRMSHVHFHFIPIHRNCSVYPTQMLPNRRRLEYFKEFAINPENCMPLIEKLKQSL